MTIPLRYEDLTVEQFIKLEALKKLEDIDLIDRAVKRVAILSGKTEDEIEALPPKAVFDTLSLALFLTSPIHSMPLVDEFTIGKKKFKAITKNTVYSVAQHRDFNEFIKANNGDYIPCLAELIFISHHELVNDKWVYNELNFEENVELFKQAKLKDVLGAVFFYSNCLQNYMINIKTCLEENQKIVNDHTEKMMKDQEFQIFLRDGDMNIG
jgi:hypothetical protein